jgi:hypothetical protein
VHSHPRHSPCVAITCWRSSAPPSRLDALTVLCGAVGGRPRLTPLRAMTTPRRRFRRLPRSGSWPISGCRSPTSATWRASTRRSPRPRRSVFPGGRQALRRRHHPQDRTWPGAPPVG